ncbi:MAG: pantetheine-phosphate adenylyltransferase [Acidimicrobiaceae bacterium]|nr:pantetheine-phosphate adenylyltransferase [Acidimicrobiaceae bacterium]MEC7844966.1 pantetheine-phosphate adenylyltransferase [Actinomycetota bacterium]
MTKAMYPGSFDPLHLGHLNIVEIAASIFDEVVVVTMQNPEKKSFLSLEAREDLLKSSFSHLPNVSTANSSGLVVNAAVDLEATVIVKGLRSTGDFEIEMQMAQTNKTVAGVETIFIPSEPAHSHISSRFIREIATLGGDVSALVPESVASLLSGRLNDE